MWHAPERTPTQRLLELKLRWQAEERAIATILAELESDLEETQRELAFYRMVGEPQPALVARQAELRSECDSLTTELAHVRLALAGVVAELGLDRWSDLASARTPA